MRRLILVMACLLLPVAGPAWATPLTLGLDDLIGTIVPGTPASVLDEMTRGNMLIQYYNSGEFNPTIIVIGKKSYTFDVEAGTNVPAASLPELTGGVQVMAGALVNYELSSPYLYLMAKFGQDNALYYLGGQTGNISSTGFIEIPWNSPGYGLSHITLFNSTSDNHEAPEPGTLLLLGAGLLGLAGYRKFRKQ